MLPLRCSRPSISVSKSTSFWPSTIARRRSSGCVALISMRFIQSPFAPALHWRNAAAHLIYVARLAPRDRHDAGETQSNPLARIALDCVVKGPNGPFRRAALARACQRSAGALRGVCPKRCIVSSGHAATRAAAAWRREHRSGMEWADGDDMRCGRRWTRVQGRPEDRLAPEFFGCPSRLGSCCVSLVPTAPGRRVTWGPRPTWGGVGIASPATCADSGASGLTFEPAVPRVNSGKSSTYGTIVDRRIIGGKGRSGAPHASLAPGRCRTPGVTLVTPAAPQVQHLRVDEASAGQRLDNFLLRRLKGVPKTHVYRVIRSGEVRVNKGRAAADTRVQRATRCACRRCAWPNDRPRRRRRRASSRCCSRTSRCSPSTSRPAWRCTAAAA